MHGQACAVITVLLYKLKKHISKKGNEEVLWWNSDILIHINWWLIAMQAKVVLAILAVLMMSAIMLSSMATAYMMFLLGPIAVGGLVVLFCAMLCEWRCGIYIFMVICVAGLVRFC